MTPENAPKEGATSLEKFHQDLEAIYNNWDDARKVWVVNFEYFDPDRKL